MSRRSCVNDPDNFCYVCGQFNALDQRKNLTQILKTAYKHYFGCQVSDHDKSWAPVVCCTACYSGLTVEIFPVTKKIKFVGQRNVA